ncbi:MAG TPA: right-handed parallel beta-helix repeat-containing protein, partial [Promineifilum sp.]|nr:right-handed parallel beta-helix repeat-containing protein [Promineifilum sp.]
SAGDSGLDTIDLQTDVTLTASYGNYYYSDTGLPLVTEDLIIEGNGHTIARDGAAPDFRILATLTGVDLTVNDTTISGGSSVAGARGGAIYSLGILTIDNSTFSGNDAGLNGGAIFSAGPTMTITGSTFSGNSAYSAGGAIFVSSGTTDITNSTISGNTAGYGGGIFNDSYLAITNSTITDNTATGPYGGGLYDSGSATFVRSIVSGNSSAIGGEEIDDFFGSLTVDEYNIFGFNGNDGITVGGPGASDIVPGAGVYVADILDTTLTDNGGPTMTHNLVPGSPALDVTSDADCAAAPVNGLDQRGAARPFDVPGEGNDGADTCDIGAVEYGSAVPDDTAVFMSTTLPGTTGDGLPFGSEDIIKWDGSAWSMWFDGSAAGLAPTGKWKHNINAFWIPDASADDVLISFTQNRRPVPGLVDPVDGMDLVYWDGSTFSFWFDGSDVGLTNKTQEKIDGLHVLPGSQSPIGSGCLSYLLISTQGPGKVPNYSGGQLKFQGEDVVGFCATSLGENTTGLWHMVLDGSVEGMPRNATDSISVSADGNTLYLTTQRTFNVDSASGGHSMVYAYDFGTGTFSGPYFDAPANGLPEKVDGLQVEGELGN